jgi:hypothetical protein
MKWVVGLVVVEIVILGVDKIWGLTRFMEAGRQGGGAIDERPKACMAAS